MNYECSHIYNMIVSSRCVLIWITSLSLVNYFCIKTLTSDRGIRSNTLNPLQAPRLRSATSPVVNSLLHFEIGTVHDEAVAAFARRELLAYEKALEKSIQAVSALSSTSMTVSSFDSKLDVAMTPQSDSQRTQRAGVGRPKCITL